MAVYRGVDEILKAAIKKERDDSALRLKFWQLDLRSAVNTDETMFYRIVNARSEAVKAETILIIKRIAVRWSAFAARFQ